LLDENRLALIRRWSMAGAREELGLRAEAQRRAAEPARRRVVAPVQGPRESEVESERRHLHAEPIHA